jgi:hypothetical protein
MREKEKGLPIRMARTNHKRHRQGWGILRTNRMALEVLRAVASLPIPPWRLVLMRREDNVLGQEVLPVLSGIHHEYI